MPVDKFLPPFIDFVAKNFKIERHEFHFISTPRYEYGLINYSNVSWVFKPMHYIRLYFEMCRAEKILLHSMPKYTVAIILAMQPWLLKKCYLTMWGWDLYAYLTPKNLSRKLYELVRSIIFRNVAYFLYFVPGDFLLAKKWYGAKGKYVKCFMYQSNLYKKIESSKIKNCERVFLLGNSADPTNDHINLLNKLAIYSGDNVKIYCPLSYGDPTNKLLVMAEGYKLFGSKFIPLEEYVSVDEYYEILSEVDTVVFGHKRQQALGNTITFLGMGKRVYLRSDTTTWELLKSLKLEIFNVDNIGDKNIYPFDLEKNIDIIENEFSEANLKMQLSCIFDESIGG